MYFSDQKLCDIHEAEVAVKAAHTVEDLRASLLTICAILKDDLEQSGASTLPVFRTSPLTD
jgi:lipoate synthase